MMAVIMVIASIYVTTALFDVRGTIDQERIYKTQLHIDNLKNAIADYRVNNPNRALNNITELIQRPSVGASSLASCYLSYSLNANTMRVPQGWCGPYFDITLYLATASAYQEDAWGTVFQLSSSGSTGAYIYTVKSCGEDKSCSTADDISLAF